jgi:hypothetical protein
MALVILRIVRNTPNKLVSVVKAADFVEEMPGSILGLDFE